MHANKMIKVLAILLGIVCCVSPAAGFSDDVERYDTGYTDVWTPTFTLVSGTIGSQSHTVSVVSDPRGVTNTNLKITNSVAKYASQVTVTYTIKPDTPSDPYYYSYIITDQVLGGYYAEAGSHEYLYVEILKESDDTTVATISVEDTLYTIQDEGSKIEIIQSESYYDFYVDGVLISSTVADIPSYDEEVYFCIGTKVYTNEADYHASSIDIYIDDITDSSIIGCPEVITEATTNLTFTRSTTLERSYPSSDFTISLYSLSNSDNIGLVREWTIPDDENSTTDEFGYITLDREDIIDNYFGIYLLEMERDTTVMWDTYFVFSSIADPMQYPETLWYFTPDVDMTIYDADNNGGYVYGGDSVYLYPENDSAIYPFSLTLEDIPYAFEVIVNAVYGGDYVNNTIFNFANLNYPYVVQLDGVDVSGGHASGALTISDNVTDGETVTIGDDIYEFNSTGGVSVGNIDVAIGNVSTTGTNIATAINTDGTEDVTATVDCGDYAYTATCTVTDPSDQDDFQTPFNVSWYTGMQSGGDDITFWIDGDQLDHWIDRDNSINDSYFTGYVSLPADTTSFTLRFGNGSAADSSTTDVFELYDDAEDGDLSDWTVGSGATLTIDATKPVGSDYCMKLESSSTSVGAYKLIPSTTSCVVEVDVYNEATASATKIAIFDDVYANLDGVLVSGSSSGYGYYDGSWHYTGSFTGSTWHNMQITAESMSLLSLVSDDASIFSSVSTVGTGTAYDRLYLMVAPASGSATSYYDNVRVRKYEATMPSVAVGTVIPTPTVVTVSADEAGEEPNEISTTDTCANASWSSSTLLGGTDGHHVTPTTWSYSITDWSTHIFTFSPDLTLPGVYGYVKETDTNDPIERATITIANDTWSTALYSDENGLYYWYEEAVIGESYHVSAAKSGYTETTEYTVTTTASATTRKDLLMESAISDGSGIYYAAHYTAIVVVHGATKVPGVNITAVSANSTLTGTTDVNGIVGFEMSQNTLYMVSFYTGETLISSITLYPVNSLYVFDPWAIAAGTTAVLEYSKDWVDVAFAYEVDTKEIALYYNVTDGSTVSSANFTVYDTGSVFYSDTSTASTDLFSTFGNDSNYVVTFEIGTTDGKMYNASYIAIFNHTLPTGFQPFSGTYPQYLKNMFVIGLAIICFMFVGGAYSFYGQVMAALVIIGGVYTGQLVFPGDTNTKVVIAILMLIALAGYMKYKKVSGE